MPFDPHAFKGKRAAVIGLGKSGAAAAKLLARKGFQVLGSDLRPLKDLKKAIGRLPAGVKLEGGGHSERLARCGFAVKSPGLPPSLPVFAKLQAAGVPVFSELETALALTPCKNVVAVSGTNGKTTTTALAAAIFRAAAKSRRWRVYAAGNIGVPASEVAAKAGAKDVLILEASSYQLEDSSALRPRAAALLNISADHIDHHGSMRRYIEAKGRLFSGQSGEDFCVFNAADPLVFQLSRSCPGRKLYFGPKGPQVHAWMEGGKIRVRLPEGRRAAFAPPPLPGPHNLDNAMAACLLALGCGVAASAVQKGLRTFKGVEHRLEECGVVKGLRCINDSKATNVDSTIVALRSLEGAGKKVLLILGGLHKGSPYTTLKPFLDSTVKAVLTIGSAAGKIESDLGAQAHIFPCAELETAVRAAFTMGSKGDILLLSPACASFDQFKDFEERGRRFKALLKEA
jgi:UDP-N-acetylmuramoylalanine--D-glutamate ligase